MEDLLNKFFALEQEIFKAFGYEPNWRIFPMVDNRDCFWRLNSSRREVIYANSVEDLNDEEKGNYYQATVYTQRHLKTWAYRTEKFTMILMDTHCDLNVYLGVFDNSKETKENT